MKALLTARLEPAVLETFSRYMEIRPAGWGHTGVKLTPEQLAEQVDGVHALIVEYEHITEAVLARATDLRVILCCRGGPRASVDVECATRHNIPVLYTPGRNADAVADLTFGLIMTVTRRIAQTNFLIKSRRWDSVGWDTHGNAPKKRFTGPQLAGRTLGCVGFGEIGRRVARRAAAFGMAVRAYDPALQQEQGIDGVTLVDSLDELLATSDVVSLHCPPATEPLLDERAIRVLRPGSYLVNTASGSLIDETALAAAVRDGHLAGVGLDVLAEEPIAADSPLLDLDPVVLTPHIGGASDDILRTQSQLALAAFESWAFTLEPSFIVNPSVLGGETPRWQG
ncbi:MAG TPA: NAD(P)-dependent oxidoreductase [Pseudonocardiaceae bacterium]|nr:NAD(P)-dependent oxidoreductase [Pseudonocardiaceae bacterium]